MHVQDGNMVCPSCAHIYVVSAVSCGTVDPLLSLLCALQIKDGIPNMLLAEHEIRRG